MAVRLEGTIKRFIGTSSDEKPTTDVPPGSSFLEANTGIVSRFDGMTWIPQPGMSTTSESRGEDSTRAYLETIVRLLEDIREILSA